MAMQSNLFQPQFTMNTYLSMHDFQRIIDEFKSTDDNKRANDDDTKLQSRILYASYVLRWSITLISAYLK